MYYKDDKMVFQLPTDEEDGRMGGWMMMSKRRRCVFSFHHRNMHEHEMHDE